MKKLMIFGASMLLCGAMIAQKQFPEPVPTLRDGIDEGELTMNIYPNPNSGDMLNLEVSGINLDTQSNIDLSIVDRTGHPRLNQRYTVKEVTSITNRIDLSKVPPGMYTVRVVAGNTTLHQRLAIGN